MTKYEIIDRIARERRVEQMIENICKHSAPEMKDLAQMVYLAILEKPEETIVGFWERQEINFYLIRIIKNQWQTEHSPFRDMFTRYARKAKDITDALEAYDEAYTRRYGSIEDVFSNKV